MTVATDHFTTAGDEAGTAPGDRLFRPDVQGLRAVAILLVVLYHADIPGISGGYVGVDVFFVISGFVITGLLLREREARQRTSLLNFYGRRARRIIPAASVVIIVTVLVAYHSLGTLTGHETAVDGQWAALFLANVHFAASETNYLASQRPPSVLQNYWSLGVEEQFYIVYPTLFLLIGWWARRGSFRVRLSVVLVAVILASYAYSIALTSVDAQSAYYSLLTRSWELALGGLIAVNGRYLLRIPQAWAAVASWIGLTVIMVGSVTLTGSSAYPGALVAIPTIGAGLVIAAGAPAPTWGVERLLRLWPIQFIGAISFSLYLWHWPLLEIAAQSRAVTSLPVWDNVLLLLVAGVLATLTYYFLENPFRHSRFLGRRRWASLVVGLCLVVTTLAVTTYEERRPTLDLGSLTNVTTGSTCPSPSASVVSHLRSAYTSGGLHREKTSDLQSVVVIGDSTSCTLLPGLEAVGPSYGMRFENGAVIGCGVVSGEMAPDVQDGINFSMFTDKCQGEANIAETRAIERYRPSLIVWGSTDEGGSIVADTPTGSKVLVSGSPEWKTVMLQRMEDRVRQLVATGARVVLLLEPPEVDSNSLTKPGAVDLKYERMNHLLSEVAARHPDRVATVNLEARVCPSGPPCRFVVDGFGSHGSTLLKAIGSAIRPDLLHYSRTSSLWVARWLVPRIAGADKSLP